nr:nucleotide-binding domain containing protein [Caballeronia sp. INDeC2]
MPAVSGAALVLAGSASKATNAQVAEWIAARPAFRADPRALARGEAVVEAALAFIDTHAEEPVLIYATAAPDEVVSV